MDVVEYDIDQPLSLTELVLKESLNQANLPTILEEEATSQNNNLDIIKPIST